MMFGFPMTRRPVGARALANRRTICVVQVEEADGVVN
jgi:hypothetical protein